MRITVRGRDNIVVIVIYRSWSGGKTSVSRHVEESRGRHTLWLLSSKHRGSLPRPKEIDERDESYSRNGELLPRKVSSNELPARTMSTLQPLVIPAIPS